MIRASVEHEKKNGGQYQQWDNDVPLGQGITVVNVTTIKQKPVTDVRDEGFRHRGERGANV